MFSNKSKRTDDGDFFYDGQDLAQRPYYFSARSSRSSYNKARADIRPDAAPLEVSDQFFGFLFGQQSATVSSPTDRRFPDFPEVRNVSLDEPSLVEGSINDFESGVKSLSAYVDEYDNELDEIDDQIKETYKIEGAIDNFFDSIVPMVTNIEDSYIERESQTLNLFHETVDHISGLTKRLSQTHLEKDDSPQTTLATVPQPQVDSSNFDGSNINTNIQVGSRYKQTTRIIDAITTNQEMQNKFLNKEEVIASRVTNFDRRKVIARKQQLSLEAIEDLSSEDYILARQNFFYCRGRNNCKPDIPMSLLNELPKDKAAEIIEVLNFQEINTRPPDGFVVPRIVYCPSGGGKTTMIGRSTRSSDYLDIDDVCREFYDRFESFLNFLDKLTHWGPLMDRFFQYHFHRFPDIYEGKKFLMLCHPKQVPHYMRGYGNELILVPVVKQWDVRYFKRNYFSLLGVMGKPKILAHYDDYEKIIRSFFNYPSD